MDDDSRADIRNKWSSTGIDVRELYHPDNVSDQWPSNKHDDDDDDNDDNNDDDDDDDYNDILQPLLCKS